MRRAHLDSAALEQLLEADVADGSRLASVLATARAAGTPEELAGLAVARAAFETAVTRPQARSAVPKLPAATRTAAGRLLAMKAIAAVSGATLIGGVAYAASTTGALDLPWRHEPAPQHGSSTSHSGSTPGDGVPQPPGGQIRTTAPGRSVHTRTHPARATTPTHAHGADVTPPTHPSHTSVAPSHSAAVTTPAARPTKNPTPTSTPSGHEPPTTPSVRNTAPTHSPHPAPTTPPKKP